MASDRIEDTVKSLLTGFVPERLLKMIESEELKEISELEQVFEDLKIEKKKLYIDLYNYKMFYKKTYQLQIFLKTVDNLIDYMKNIEEIDLIDTYKCEIRKIINHLREKVIFCKNFNYLNKLSKVHEIQTWIIRNRCNLEFSLEKEIINNLSFLIQVLDILETDLLKINEVNLTEVQEEEFKNHIKNINEYSIQLSRENINYLKYLINTSTLTAVDKLKLLNYFHEFDFRSQFKTGSKFIEISEKAFPMIFKYKICRLEEGTEIIEQIIRSNEECFISCKNIFFQSTPDDQVTIDCLAIVFIYYLFGNYSKLYDLMKDDFEKSKKNQIPFSLIYFFERLLILPHRIQNAVLRMLIQILSKKLSKVYDYIKTYILNRSLVYEELSQEYQNEFVLKASSQPFSDVLVQFLPNKSYDLRKNLQIMAKNTIIMNTPEKIAGINLGNRMVVINQYKDDRKACTFYTFLYESRHFLQRVDKEIFGDNNRPHSPNLQIVLNQVEDIEADNHGPLSNANISKILASYLRPKKKLG